MVKLARALFRPPQGACFWAKTCDIPASSSIRCLIMRGGLMALTFVALLVQPSFAQGVKDKANLTSTSIVTTTTTKKTLTTEPTRPTAIRNLAPGTLPSGTAAQGVWRDGKLVAVPRQ